MQDGPKIVKINNKWYLEFDTEPEQTNIWSDFEDNDDIVYINGKWYLPCKIKPEQTNIWS